MPLGVPERIALQLHAVNGAVISVGYVAVVYHDSLPRGFLRLGLAEQFFKGQIRVARGPPCSEIGSKGWKDVSTTSTNLASIRPQSSSND